MCGCDTTCRLKARGYGADYAVNVTSMAVIAKQLKDIGLDKVQFITVPFQAYAPDPNRLQISADAELLWQRLKSDEPIGRRYGGEAVKASDGVKGDKDATAKQKARRAAMAAANGLCYQP